MKKFFLGSLVLLMAAVIFVPAARALDFKEGKWTMTMVTKMDNMSPEMAAAMQKMQNMPPQVAEMLKAKGIDMSANAEGMTVTTTQCMTHDHPVPQHVKNNMSSYCQETHEINGNTVTFHTSCSHDDFQMDASGNMSYEGDTMRGHITSHQTKAGNAMDSTVDITGQYLGPCS